MCSYSGRRVAGHTRQQGPSHSGRGRVPFGDPLLYPMGWARAPSAWKFRLVLR
jgi:hypothetical protein